MRALRCTRCGDTRWSLSGFQGRFSQYAQPRCELCGADMVEERRQPNQGPATLHLERRTAHLNPRSPAARR